MNHFATQAIFNKPNKPIALGVIEVAAAAAPKIPRKQRPSIPPAREWLEQQANIRNHKHEN